MNTTTLFLFSLFFVSCITCPVYYNRNTGLYYDLTPLSNQDWGISQLRDTVYFTFCVPLRYSCSLYESVDPQSACLKQGGALFDYKLGETDSMEITPNGYNDGVIVKYYNGVQCSNQLSMITQIQVHCDRLSGTGNPYDMYIDDRSCTTTIDFHSAFGCGSTSPSTPSPSKVPSASLISMGISPSASQSIVHASASANPIPVSASRTPSPSPFPSPIPYSKLTLKGIDQLGYGFSLLNSSSAFGSRVGLPLSNPVFQGYTYYQNKSWIVDNEKYIYPDQVSVFTSDDFGVKTFTYQGVSEYFEQVAYNYGVSLDYRFHHIPIGGSIYFKNILSQLKNDEAVLSIAKENIPLYNLRLGSQVSFDANFINRVNTLTSSGLYDFLDDYGTHVQTGLDMGGQLSLIGAVEASNSMDHTSMNIQVGARISFFHFTCNISPFNGINKNQIPSYYSNYQTFKEGGDTSITDYSSWVSSIPSYPAAINYELSSIIELMNEINPQAASLYEDFLNQEISKLDANLDVDYETPNGLITLNYGNADCNTTLRQGPITELQVFHDDDDSCQTGEWWVQDNEDTITLECKIPTVISWADSNTFGSTPYATSFNSLNLNDKQTRVQNSKTFEQIDMQCGSHPCIPGLSSLGAGFDIVTGDIRLPNMQWTFNNNKLWQDPNSGYTFAYPDQVILESDSSSTKEEYVFTSFSDYLYNSSGSYSTGINLHFFQFGEEEQNVRRGFDGAQSILGLVIEYYTRYGMSITNTNVSSILLDEIAQLPEKYDSVIYYQFLLRWGTHFASEATYGGKAKLHSFIDQEYFISTSRSKIESGLSVQFDNWEAGIAWGNTEFNSTYEFSTESAQWITFYGGDATLALTNQWNEWIDSTHRSPAQVTRELTPISSLTSSTTIASNLNTAIQEYMSQGAEQLLVKPISLDMHLTADSTSMVINGYQDTCTFSHDLFWDHKTTFATSDTKMGYHYSGGFGYLIPEIFTSIAKIQDLYSSDTVVSCPTNSFLSFIGDSYTGCSSCDNVLPLGGYMVCSYLQYESA